MDLVGSLRMNDVEYIVGIRDNKTNITFALLNLYHRDDIVGISQGKPATKPRLSLSTLKKVDDIDSYVLGIVTRTKTTGQISGYGQTYQLLNVLSDLGTLQLYRFPEETIRVDTFDKSGIDTRNEFEAAMDAAFFSFIKENNIFKRLEFRYNSVNLRAYPGPFPLVMKNYTSEMKPIEKNRSKAISEALINSMDYRTLRSYINLNWYENVEQKLKHKNYFPVRNKLEVEELVINDMKNELIRCRLMGEKMEVVLDTETTGFVFLNLEKDNELLDRMVCISLSWKANSSALIFLDMEHFDNVDVDYVVTRLKPFLERDFVNKDDITIKTYEKTTATSSDVPEGAALIDAFSVTESGTIFQGYHTVDFTFNRDEIWVITHNGMFDGKVMYHYGLKMYFDMDTLQLAFNLNPKLGKGNNKLENLIDKILGITVPSLTLILGKGNEGAYRFIKDLDVALIYAGSDTDNLRFVHKYLKDISGEYYQLTIDQDIFLMNQLFVMEYNGLRIDKENFKKEAEIIQKRMRFLEEWLHKYVGAHIKKQNLKTLAKNMIQSGATKEQVMAFWEEKSKEEDTPYSFEISGESLRNVLFEILKYPKLKLGKPSKAHPAGVPSTDKFVIEKMVNAKLAKPTDRAKLDLVHPDELDQDGKPIRKDAVLVEAKKLNRAEYPVAHILAKYAELKKEYDSYFGPFLNENYGTLISRGFSMTRIETRRIMNPLQTMKARLKRYILPYTKDHYKVVFDQSQVEPRIMMSLAGAVEQMIKFLNPEVDYHTENAANISGIPAHILPKDIRKKYKEITLGLPYGLGLKKMCLRIFKELTTNNEYETRKAILAWQKANAEIWEKLNEFRAEGLKPAKIAEGLREFISKITETDINTVYGKAVNLIGFYRLFDLTKYLAGEKDADGKVMRPAGNYPIQSFAAELFRIILRRLILKVHEEGLSDKVMLHMLVHDEGTMSVHKDVHPVKMIKILYKSCVVSIKGHTKYYIGINIGENWADGKDDEAECPIYFVQELIEKWDAGEFRNDDYWNWQYTFRHSDNKLKTFRGPKAYIYELKQDFMVRRIKTVIEEYLPHVATEKHLDVRELLPIFANYTVRSYIPTFFPQNFDPVEMPEDSEEDYANRKFCAHLESVLVSAYGEGFKFTDSDGKTKLLKARDFNAEVVEEEILDLEFDIPEDDKTEKLMEMDSYYSFDSIEANEYVNSNLVEDDLLSEDALIDKYYVPQTDNKGRTTLVMKKKTTDLTYVEDMPTHFNLVVPYTKRDRVKSALSSFLKPIKGGRPVMFTGGGGAERWISISKDISAKQLDDAIKGVLDG